MRIVVTGGTGKGGKWVVRELRDAGHDVLNVDARHDGSPHGQCLVTDLTDLGQTLDALSGAEAVVHFAAIPAPEIRPTGETFRINAMSTYNVFAATELHAMRRVVWASSETVLGLPFDTPPMFAPIDETIEPRPESSYSLSKLVGEAMAIQFARRSGTVGKTSAIRSALGRVITVSPAATMQISAPWMSASSPRRTAVATSRAST
jgi:nucleoside-diphosphate-sugar epimerase